MSTFEQPHSPSACATAIRGRIELAQRCYRVTLAPYGDISDECVKDACKQF